jgi:phosphoserine phosphatase
MSPKVIFFEKSALALAISVFSAYFARAAENHVDSLVEEIVTNVAKVKAADPGAVPMAFWDFDGTVICGDITLGHSVDGRVAYDGLFVKACENGFSAILKDRAAAERFVAVDYPKMGEGIGRWLSWPLLGQVFHGADAAELESFSSQYAKTTLRRWFFSSSIKIMRELEKAGVENYIISGSPDVFVKAAGAEAGIDRLRSLGIRQRVAGGRLTSQLEYPLSMNEGKVECLREIVTACPGGVAVAAFGNSYWTDGPFMRYVATNPLPGGAKGRALMINGGTPPKGYEGLFRCVTQDETRGGVEK